MVVKYFSFKFVLCKTMGTKISGTVKSTRVIEASVVTFPVMRPALQTGEVLTLPLLFFPFDLKSRGYIKILNFTCFNMVCS